MKRTEPWAIVGAKGKVLALEPGERVVGVLDNKEFEKLFGFIPAIDIKLTPQQTETIKKYIKRRDRKK